MNKINSLSKWEYLYQRRVTNQAKRNVHIERQRRKSGKATYDTSNSLVDPTRIEQHVADLKGPGFTDLGKIISDEQVEAIKKAVEPIPFTEKLGETNTGRYSEENLLKIKEITDLATDPGILEIAQGFLGAKPELAGLPMWWSYAGKQEAQNAQLYHRDLDNWIFCKFFVYLTDVELESGPNIYFTNSSNSEKCRDKIRYTDQEVIEAFGEENRQVVTRPKGHAFMADTFGMHKGLLPEKNDRLIIVFLYCIQPIGAIDKPLI